MRFRPPEIFLGSFLTVAVFAMGMVFWSSYQPSPAAKNQSQQTEGAAQDRETSKPPTAEGTKVSQGHQQQEYKSEFWSAKLTDWLLTIFTALLGVFTYRLWKSTDNLWAESKLQRTENKLTADRQFETTQKSIELARQEFVSTHRPRIILREAIIGSVLEGEPINVSFHLANVGETAGRIVRSSVRVQIVPRSDESLLLHGSIETEDQLGEISLGPGMAILLKFQGETPKWERQRYGEKSTVAFGGGVLLYRDATIHFVGQIMYVDETGGIPRRTAFRRELIPERQRFYRILDEPDQDYSD
jgi:hypothetical protein